MPEPDVYDPRDVMTEARQAAARAVGLSAYAGGAAAARYGNAVDAALTLVADRLIAVFDRAIADRSDAEQDSFDGGYATALDWVCRELVALKEAR